MPYYRLLRASDGGTRNDNTLIYSSSHSFAYPPTPPPSRPPTRSNQTQAETALRSVIFEEKLAEINAHNAAGKTWTKAVNKWSDLTGDEWRARVLPGRLLKLEDDSAAEAPEVVPLWGANPASVNWTAGAGPNNVIADAGVKDQGQVSARAGSHQGACARGPVSAS